MKQEGFWNPTRTLVAAYTFAWGFASLDRLLIAMLFPFVIPYFGMTYAQAGLIMTCMSVLYLIMASLGGALSDKYGRKKVILPSVIIFSISSFLTGFATNFATLIGIRSVIGAAEGSFYTSGAAQIAEQSPDESRGTALGLYNSSFPLFGACIAPIYATLVASRWGWQWACYLTIIPGIILAYVISTKVRDAQPLAHARHQGTPRTPWSSVFKDRNIVLAGLLSATWLVWLWTWLSFGLLFLTKVKGLPGNAAGLLLSALGLGGCLGAILNSKLSDNFGRKPVTVIGTLIGILGTVIVVATPNIPMGGLFLILLVTGTACWGNAPICLQVIPSDSVSGEHLAKTIGIIVAFGELFGIAVAPPIVGFVGDRFGLAAAMYVGVASLVLMTFCGLFLRESAPRVCARRAAGSVA
ncbi:MAG: transporter [Holophagaceae bacterium]|uniref:MFS transporter n=1 Tax=Holophaga foetida TaxID=35839 RepID=UPI0002472173|nr:MFS transporter [Holophaga foetida]MBP1627654.1 transporter [Holophagaceae bacterium]